MRHFRTRCHRHCFFSAHQIPPVNNSRAFRQWSQVHQSRQPLLPGSQSLLILPILIPPRSGPASALIALLITPKGGQGFTGFLRRYTIRLSRKQLPLIQRSTVLGRQLLQSTYPLHPGNSLHHIHHIADLALPRSEDPLLPTTTTTSFLLGCEV